MVTFDTKQRFKLLDDGLIYASAGVQTNCGGIAAIIVKIEKLESGELIFNVEDNDGWDGDTNCARYVPGNRLNAYYKNAVFEGAKLAASAPGNNTGFIFTLVEALVHPVDANTEKFKEAGYRAVKGWLEMKKGLGSQGFRERHVRTDQGKCIKKA